MHLKKSLMTKADIEIRRPLRQRILRPMLVVLSKYVYNLTVTATIIFNRVGQPFQRLQVIIGINKRKPVKSSAKDTYLLMISFETDIEFDCAVSEQLKH